MGSDDLKKVDSFTFYVDGDSSNTSSSNTFTCTKQELERFKSQLEEISLSLVREGLILFSPKSGYEASPSLKASSMPVSLGFEDVTLEQVPNVCESRSDASTVSEVIKGVKLRVPLMASNMSTVTNSSFCIELSKLGAMGVLHRAADPEVLVRHTSEMSKEIEWVAVSIGVGDSQFSLAEKLIKAGANIIFIDIAHGYSDSVISLGRRLKSKYPHIKVVVGNTINPDMLDEVADFADALKVGIGSGLACTTKNTAGCFSKQFSAVDRFKNAYRRTGIPIISDGGIREPADFTKAIAAGANSVMAGSIFAACPESAAPLEGGKKVYAGMASEWTQQRWRGGLKPGTCAEGRVVMLEVGDPVSKLVQTYEGALRSGITYTGAKDVNGMQEKAVFVRLSKS